MRVEQNYCIYLGKEKVSLLRQYCFVNITCICRKGAPLERRPFSVPPVIFVDLLLKVDYTDIAAVNGSICEVKVR